MLYREICRKFYNMPTLQLLKLIEAFGVHQRITSREDNEIRRGLVKIIKKTHGNKGSLNQYRRIILFVISREGTTAT